MSKLCYLGSEARERAACRPSERSDFVKKTLTGILCLALILSLFAPVFADVTSRCAVIGANLTEDQIASVYRQFGVRRGDVLELTLTNAEERRYLEGFVADSVIGTRSISCVYVELLPAGSGISVSTSNISWCTGQMYVSALATAGVTDARILVAAPFEVSGTAALAGVYKAYEEMTGARLDDVAKLVSTQELTITGDLAQQIGSADSTSIVGELKLMLDETKNMSDDEIRNVIVEIAARYNVRLTDTQISQLVTLCRSLENLNPDQLRQRVEEVQGTLRRMSEAKGKIVSFAESVKEFMDSLSGFFDKLRDLLDKFSK